MIAYQLSNSFRIAQELGLGKSLDANSFGAPPDTLRNYNEYIKIRDRDRDETLIIEGRTLEFDTTYEWDPYELNVPASNLARTASNTLEPGDVHNFLPSLEETVRKIYSIIALLSNPPPPFPHTYAVCVEG